MYLDYSVSYQPGLYRPAPNGQLELSALRSIAVNRPRSSSSLMFPSTRGRAAAQLQVR